jgi:hypothetical protein
MAGSFKPEHTIQITVLDEGGVPVTRQECSGNAPVHILLSAISAQVLRALRELGYNAEGDRLDFIEGEVGLADMDIDVPDTLPEDW